MSIRHASDLKIVPLSVRLQIIGNGGSSVIFFGNVLDAARAPTGTRVCVKIASSEAGKRQLRPRGSEGAPGEVGRTGATSQRSTTPSLRSCQ